MVSPGSACLIAAVPEEWIESIPPADPVTGRIVADIVLKAGRKWLRVVLVSRTRFFKEETQRGDPGKSWLQSITGRSCGNSQALYDQLGRWTDHRWVLLYKEVGTHITYLIGKPGSGAIMNVQYSNEKATVTSVSFARTAIVRAPDYAGSYTLDNNTTISNQDDVNRIFYRHNAADATVFSFPALIGKKLLFVSRSGTKDLEVIDSTPTKDSEVKFDSTTGTLTLSADYPLTAPDETLTILYK